MATSTDLVVALVIGGLGLIGTIITLARTTQKRTQEGQDAGSSVKSLALEMEAARQENDRMSRIERDVHEILEFMKLAADPDFKQGRGFCGSDEGIRRIERLIVKLSDQVEEQRKSG